MTVPGTNIHTFKWIDEDKKRRQHDDDEVEVKVVYSYDKNKDYGPNARAKAEVYGIDGNPQEFELEIPINYWKYYGYACCPCFIPPPCNAANSHRWCLLMASASFILSVIDVIMLIVEIALDGFADPAYNWMLGPETSAIKTLGCKYAYAIKEDYELWRLITPIFLHGGILHLVMNLAMQIRTGLIIERRMNTWRYLLVYFGSGICANCYSIMCYPNTLGVGASGALLGIFGGFLVDIILNKNQFQTATWLNLIAQELLSVVIIFVFSFAPGIDYVAHIFGFVSGAIITFGLLCHKCEFINNRIYLKILIWIFSIAFCAFSLILCLLLLYLDVLDAHPL